MVWCGGGLAFQNVIGILEFTYKYLHDVYCIHDRFIVTRIDDSFAFASIVSFIMSVGNPKKK